jgi:hypothetical protein
MAPETENFFTDHFLKSVDKRQGKDHGSHAQGRSGDG